MHKSSISSVEIATGMFMRLFNSLFLPMFCYLPFILRYFMILCVFISCPSTFLSCALLPCPSIICSYPYPFIVPACHVQILTDRIFGMHDLGHHGGHNLYVWILGEKNKYTLIQKHFLSCSHSFHAFHSPVSFLSVSFHFLPCSFYFRQSYLCFTFTLFNFPPFLLFFHVLLMFLWFPFPFVSFSFSSSFHVPFILLSCHFSFLPFFLQVIPFFLYVLSFFKIISNFRAYSFQIMFMVLGSFHDLPCSFMHRGANSLCDNVQQF